MADSVLRGTIDFFTHLGIYDVVLPFLLVFTIVFAILEKTKLFGLEKIGKEEYTRKSLNAMTAFVIALLVVASSQIVAIINESLAKVVLLLLVGISFLMLIGTFFSRSEEVILKGAWRTLGMVFMGVGVLLIFAYQLGWLVPFWNYLVDNWDNSIVGSVVLLILIVAFMGYITKEDKPQGGSGSGGSH